MDRCQNSNEASHDEIVRIEAAMTSSEIPLESLGTAATLKTREQPVDTNPTTQSTATTSSPQAEGGTRHSQGSQQGKHAPVSNGALHLDVERIDRLMSQTETLARLAAKLLETMASARK